MNYTVRVDRKTGKLAFKKPVENSDAGDQKVAKGLVVSRLADLEQILHDVVFEVFQNVEMRGAGCKPPGCT